MDRTAGYRYNLNPGTRILDPWGKMEALGMPGEEDVLGYTLSLYITRGLPPERSEFTDKAKAEKAFQDAKAAAILWQTRPPGQGLGWIKLKEKEAPPAPLEKPAVAPAPAKPA